MEDPTAAPEATATTTEPLPELHPWQVGWIFRDGGCVAIERQADVTPGLGVDR